MSNVSVIIPTHNPNEERLLKTLEGLRKQTLPCEEWELVIIDNASEDPDALKMYDLSWHPSARIVREEKLGLTAARIRGFEEAKNDYLLMVDDDNVLDPHYLENVIEIFAKHPDVAAAGGKSIPRFEKQPESWVRGFDKSLALRDMGNEVLIKGFENGSRAYPECAPIGAGMALRREVVTEYLSRLRSRTKVIMDRTGKKLCSGGDNDIVLTALDEGWKVGYFPQLSLVHLIPPGRCERDYLARLNRSSSQSWVQVLDSHGIHSWKPLPGWLLKPLQFRLFLRTRAWRGPAEYIEWQNRCGLLEGRAKLDAMAGKTDN